MKRTILLGTALGLATALAIAYGPGRDSDLPPIVGAVVGCFVLIPIGILLTFALPRAFALARAVPFLKRAWLMGTIFFLVAGIASTFGSRSDARAFALQGDSTTGTVLSIHPQDHNTIEVSYTALGKAYTRRIPAVGLARDVVPGTTVAVYFLRDDPTVTRSEWPRWTPQEDLFGTALAALLMPAVLIGLGGSWLQARGRLPPAK